MATRILGRLERCNVQSSADAVAGCAEYLLLLRRWSVKLNLTGFDLHHLSDAALDRLVVEPLAAARLVRPADLSVVDIGTGGGSPAVPFKLACPSLRATWFEARVRKAAFLREVVRSLDLHSVQVATAMFGDTTECDHAADLVTLRAVRLDKNLVSAIRRALTNRGRLLVFGTNRFDDAAFATKTLPLWATGPEVILATPLSTDSSDNQPTTLLDVPRGTLDLDD